jgi:hypothetical protein
LTHPEKELDRIIAAISQGAKAIELAPCFLDGEPVSNKANPYCRVRTARMVSDTSAKITITSYWGGDYSSTPDDERNTLFINLSWSNQ